MAVAPERFHIADIDRQAETERLQCYRRAWDAYDGEGPEPLEVGPGEPDDNIRFDYAAVIVDKGVSFLAGKGGVEYQLTPAKAPEGENAEDAAASAKERAEAALEEAWPEERRTIDFQKLGTNGGICGQAWLRLDEDGSVSVLDPTTCTAVWDPDNIDILERFLIEWTTLDRDEYSATHGLGVARRERIEPNDAAAPTSWMTYVEELDDEQGSTWTIIDERAWPHVYPPILTCQNLPAPDTFYGRADLEPAIIDQIEQLESVASDMRRQVRFYGHPTPIAFGSGADSLNNINVPVGSIIGIPDPEGHVETLAIAELTSSLALFETLKTAMLEATRIPKVALGETDNAGPVTGVALQVEYEPLIEKTETKRLTYGSLLVEAARRILDLKGLGEWTVALSWPKLLPADTTADAQSDESELRMGVVSKRTIAEKRGYDWDEEQQRIAEEVPQFDHGEPGLPGGGGLVLPGEGE